MKGRSAFLIWKQTGSKPRLCFGSPIRLLADPYHLHHRTRGPVGPLSDSRRPKMTKKSRKPAKLSKPARPARRAKAAKHAKAATQTAPAKKTTPAKPPGKVHVLFGADEYAKPRAARFTGADLEPLTKAAAAMAAELRLRFSTGNNGESTWIPELNRFARSMTSCDKTLAAASPS